MHSADQTIPIFTSAKSFYTKDKKARKPQVNKRVFYLSVQAIGNAICIGLIARGLIFLIDCITNIFFYGRFSFAPSSPAGNHLGLMVLFIPLIGGLLVGLIARFGSRAITGHGIPEAMEKIIIDDSRIPPIITFLKPLSAALSIGTGGPFGAEGPIIATGGAFGSFTGQLIHISSAERKILLAAGACAGMSAIFGSPLAAVMLAIELLLFEFSPRSIIPVALSCTTGAGMHILLFGKGPVFAMQAVPVPDNLALFVYVLFGLIIGIAAVGVSKSVYAIEDLFEKIPLHWMWWPAIGAIAIGTIGFFAPHTMGVGYDNIVYLLHGSWSLRILFSLCILKYLSWAISLGSGTSGGTLAPLFTIGGAFGGLLGLLTIYWFPSLHVNAATAALIGMAAMFAGASRALLTALIFAMETTGSTNVLLPLLGACSAAYFVSFFLMKGGIMTEKIKRRGIRTPDAYEPDLLQRIPVKQLLKSPSSQAASGMFYIYANDDLGFAAEMMGKYNTDAVAVLDHKEKGKVIGVISSRDILRYYSEEKQKDHSYHSPGRTRRLLVRGRRLLQNGKTILKSIESPT